MDSEKGENQNLHGQKKGSSLENKSEEEQQKQQKKQQGKCPENPVSSISSFFVIGKCFKFIWHNNTTGNNPLHRFFN